MDDDREAPARTEAERLRAALADAVDAPDDVARRTMDRADLAAAERARAALGPHPVPRPPVSPRIGLPDDWGKDCGVVCAGCERRLGGVHRGPASTSKPEGARVMMRLPHDESDPQKLYSFPDPDVLVDSYIALRDEVHPPFADSAEFAVGRRERSDSGKRVVTYTHAAYVLMLANAYLTLTTYELGQEHCLRKLRDIWRARRATPADRRNTAERTRSR